MPRVLYGVSPIGLGHATRSLVVVRELEREGAEVRVFSGGKAAEFLGDNGLRVDETVDDAGPSIVRGEMKGVVSWYIRSWLAQRRNVARAGSLIDAFSPDVVVGDEEFSGVIAAGERGMKRVFIADELSLGFARTWLASRIEERVGRWYEGVQKGVDLLIIPEEGEDVGNRAFVGPIVRPPTAPCAEVRRKLGVPPGRMLLVSLSGSGAGRELVERCIAVVKGFGPGWGTLVVTGNRGGRFEGEGVLDLGVVNENQDLVYCADLVVSTAGKSTIDEASAAGTPVIAIPILHHVEQERNAASLGYAHGDIARLGSLIGEKVGVRSPPRSFGGGSAAAGAILKLLSGG